MYKPFRYLCDIHPFRAAKKHAGIMSQDHSKKRANLRDVAKAAGVSVATVSRVMNAPKTVSQQTRQKVEAAMTALRWRPSAAARAINSGRSRFVGALVPTLDNAIFARFLSHLESGLNLHGLSLVVATTGGDPKVETEKAHTLLDIGAEGFVLSGISQDPALLDLIDHMQIATIVTSFFDPNYVLPTIGYDNAEASRIALSHLEGQGHRDIAVFHGPKSLNDRTRARLQGLGDHHVDSALTFYETPLSTRGGCDAADMVLQQARRPTAILCLSDVLAAGAMSELQRQGIGVPDDISVMGIDDLPSSATLYPALTTVHLPVASMGTAAADALALWVEKGEKPAPRRFGPELALRASTQRVD